MATDKTDRKTERHTHTNTPVAPAKARRRLWLHYNSSRCVRVHPCPTYGVQIPRRGNRTGTAVNRTREHGTVSTTCVHMKNGVISPVPVHSRPWERVAWQPLLCTLHAPCAPYPHHVMRYHEHFTRSFSTAVPVLVRERYLQYCGCTI